MQNIIKFCTTSLIGVRCVKYMIRTSRNIKINTQQTTPSPTHCQCDSTNTSYAFFYTDSYIQLRIYEYFGNHTQKRDFQKMKIVLSNNNIGRLTKTLKEYPQRFLFKITCRHVDGQIFINVNYVGASSVFNKNLQNMKMAIHCCKMQGIIAKVVPVIRRIPIE